MALAARVLPYVTCFARFGYWSNRTDVLEKLTTRF